MPITAHIQFSYEDILQLVLQLSYQERQQLIAEVSQQTALQDIAQQYQAVGGYMPLENLRLVRIMDLENQTYSYQATQEESIVGLLADEPSLIHFGK